MKHISREQNEVQTTTLTVGGMSCGACVRHVIRALDGLTGVVHAEVDLERGEALVEYLPAFIDSTALVAALKDAGYIARVSETPEQPSDTSPSAARISGCGSGCCGNLAPADAKVAVR